MTFGRLVGRITKEGFGAISALIMMNRKLYKFIPLSLLKFCFASVCNLLLFFACNTRVV